MSAARTTTESNVFSVPVGRENTFANVSITPDVWKERVDTAILFGFFGSLGIVLNALPILLTLCTKMRHNKVHCMIATLSTADLLFSVSFVFGQTQYVLYREQLSLAPCQWLAMFTFTTAFFEFIFPPVLSINRFIALYHSERYERMFSRRNTCLIITFCWTFCAVVPVLFAALDKTKFDNDNEHCCVVVKDSPVYWSVIYWLLIIVPLICFCDGTMLFCNYKIYRKLADHGTVQSLKRNVIRQNRELLYFLFADMTFPIVFHTTYHVAKFALPNRTDIVARRVFTTLYLINSGVRGLVTLCMLRPYRVALKNTFCCLCGGLFQKESLVVFGNQVSPAEAEVGSRDHDHDHDHDHDLFHG